MFNQYQNSYKTLSIIFVDLESLIKKMDGWKNNLEKSYTTKAGKYIPSGFFNV